ncbi:uncharacterized protein LOC143368760 [Andrena cerasifolii]|uniref:uncharacterized protein LOC143368760 n=1 Tax=Andrena cerasifolii TaxID=2819439 RepID=UPI004037B49C
MGKSSRSRDRSPSVERLRKKLRKLQERLEWKLDERKIESIPRVGGVVVRMPDETIRLYKVHESEPSDIDEVSEDVVMDNENLPEIPNNLQETEKAEENNFAEMDQLAGTWEKVLQSGLKKERKTEFLEKYPRRGNCPIEPPKLNPEIEANKNETIKKRALGSAVTKIFEGQKQSINSEELLRDLVESGKLMCELFIQLTTARKAFIYPGLDAKARKVLKASETGEFLFGSELSQRIKSAKSMEKLGLSLKAQPTDKKPSFRATGALNFKGSPVTVRGQSQAGYKRHGYQRVHGQRFYSQRGNRHTGNQGHSQGRQSSSQMNRVPAQK